MHEKIAEALLVHTGHPISAVVSLGKGDRILRVFLFDTMWQTESICIDSSYERVDLISNHPEGHMAPYKEDEVNYQHLKQMCANKRVRLFIASEYFPCMEISPEE